MWRMCLAEQRAGAWTYLALYLLNRAAFSEQVPLANAALKKSGSVIQPEILTGSIAVTLCSLRAGNSSMSPGAV
jgi:hypothetical protein